MTRMYAVVGPDGEIGQVDSCEVLIDSRCNLMNGTELAAKGYTVQPVTVLLGDEQLFRRCDTCEGGRSKPGQSGFALQYDPEPCETCNGEGYVPVITTDSNSTEARESD